MNGLVLRYGNGLRGPCMPLLLLLVLVVQLLESHDILRFTCLLIITGTSYLGKEQKHQMLFNGPTWIWSVQ
uniref:Uncharacterized protein n=1 Tax=Arundo donax TaxID=35708 RepID=A0A0A9HT05_ARUDO